MNKSYFSYRRTIGKGADNIINRNFKCSVQNKKWCTDIRVFHIAGEKLYLTQIAHMNNSEIIRPVILDVMNSDQVIPVIDMAFYKILNNTGLLFYSCMV